MRTRSSFSNFDLNKALTNSYSREEFYSSIVPLSATFQGFRRENGIQPRIRIIVSNIGYTRKLLRQESERIMRIDGNLASSVSRITHLPNEASPTIDAKHLLDSFKKDQKINILVIGDNSLDNRKLIEYITYNWPSWAKDSKLSWGKFNVIRADLRTLITKPHLANLAQFLTDALNSRGIDISEQDIATLLRMEQDKTLIILEWHLKPEQLRDMEHYPFLQTILASLAKHNIIITAKHYARDYVEVPFKPIVTLENTGYISRDIEKYLENNFQDPRFYQTSLSLFNSNRDLQEICKSPSILEMVCYILLQGDKLKLQSSIKSPTMSGLYSDMIHLNGIRYGERYIKGYKGDVLSYPIIKFMQELAYKALARNCKLISNTLLSEVLAPYTNDILKGLSPDTDIIDLIKEFGIIQLDPNSNPIEPQYFFTDFSFQEFMAALHLKNLLTNSEENISSARLFITLHGNNKEYLQTMKFLFGLISMHEEEHSKLVAMETLGNALVYSSENVLKIGGNNQIIYMMHLLSQAIKNGELDPFIPQRVIDYLDHTILNNLEKWGPHLIKSQYLSTTIIAELSNMLMGNKQEFLQACQILSLLNSINLDKKNEIAQILMSKLSDTDLEIVETSVRSLQHMLDCQDVENFLIRTLSDPRVSVRLVAIEVQEQITNHHSVDPLLEGLRDQDNWTVIATLNAIKNLYHLRDRREYIISKLMKELGKEYNNRLVILPKLLECLKHFQYDYLQIHGDLLEIINKNSDVEKVNEAITSLKNLISLQMQTLNVNHVIDKMLTKYDSLRGIFSIRNSKYYSIRGNILDLLSIMFLKADTEHFNRIYALIERDIASKGEAVQIAAINALNKILINYPEKQDGIFSLLTRIINSQHIRAQILGISVIIKLGSTYLLSKDSNIISVMTNNLLTYIAGRTDKETLILAIQTLGKLSNRVSVETILFNVRATYSNIQDEDIQNTAIEVIGEIFNQLSSNMILPTLAFISDEAETNDFERVRITAIHAIVKNKEDVANIQSAVVEEYITQLTLDRRSDIVKDVAIVKFLELYDEQKKINKILELYLNAARNEAEKGAAIYSIGRLVAKTAQTIAAQTLDQIIEIFYFNLDSVIQVIPSLMIMIGKVPASKIVEISEKLFLSTQHSNPIIRSLVINALIHLATIPEGIRTQIKPLFGQDTRDKLLIEENIRNTNFLANKYSNSAFTLSTSDQIILNNLFYPILLRCLQTSNIFIHMRFINLLSKVRYDENAVLDILDYELSLHINIQDKLRLINIIRTIFNTNSSLLYKLDQIARRLVPEPIDLDVKFPNIDAIIANLEGFAQIVIENHLDIRITIDKLILPEREYSFAHLSNIELQLDYARKLYLAISAINYDVQLENQEQHLFYEITHTYLDYETVQLSVLHKTTDKHSLTDIILIAESKTIFGDHLVKRISVENHQLKLAVHRSIEKNYPQLTLGKPSEYIEYYVSSFSITFAEELSLLESLKTCRDKEHLFSILTNIFATHLANYRWQTDGISMSHNKVIRTSGYEERLSRVEHRLKDIEQQLVETIREFKGFKVSQKTINDILTTLQENERIDVSLDLDEYQRALMLKLAQGLNELHMAAMVVQTEMVSNSQQGVVGSIGTFFSTISSHVPMVGAAVDVFGSILNAVDANIQAIITKNIANLAISSSDMAHIAKALALKIATSKLKNEELNSRDILAKIASILNFTINVKNSIIGGLAQLISSRLDQQPELTNDEERGESDAVLILQILVNYIATGCCKLNINWRINYQILDNFFSKNYVIQAAEVTSSSETLLIDIGPEVEQSSTATESPTTLEQVNKTPYRIKQLRQKGQDIANKVVFKVKLLLHLETSTNIDPEQQEAFTASLNSALNREDYSENQRLLYWSDQNSALKDNLVGQLAQQLISLNAFKSEGDIVTIDPQFMVDGEAFTDIMKNARSVLCRHRYLDRSEQKILIDAPPQPNELPGITNSPDQKSNINIDLALTGGIMMKGAEVWPALKYLLTDYIPLIPLIKDNQLIKFVSQYEYPVVTTGYAIGSFMLAQGLSIHPVYALISTILFAAREPINKFREEKLNEINHMENGWIKFGLYVGTDATISLAMASPFTAITPLVTVNGLAIGSISYYNAQQPHEDNPIADIIAHTTTTIAIIPCVKFVESYHNNAGKILASGVCIGGLANIHIFSKFIGTMISEQDYHLLTGNIDNSTSIESELG